LQVVAGSNPTCHTKLSCIRLYISFKCSFTYLLQVLQVLQVFFKNYEKKN
jgi:hypothetical protein